MVEDGQRDEDGGASRATRETGTTDELSEGSSARVGEPSERLMLERVRSRVLDQEVAPVRFGRYVLLERLGAGAMGVVYGAYDPHLDRKVALKQILLSGEAHEEPTLRLRLLREARAMARLSHPNVVTVHEVGIIDGAMFLAMEYIPGATLADWLNGDDRSWPDIIDMFIRSGHGLAAAHAAGVVHRDFKPTNVLVRPDGHVKVGDFGLARALTEGARAEPAGGAAAPREVQAELTRAGALVGTPSYMAPEQFHRRPADARTDQFSFCVALYEALHGERPFAGSTVMQLAARVTTGQRADTKRRALPTWLDAAIERGLRLEPRARWPSLSALLQELEQGPVRLRRRAVTAAVLIGLAGAGALAMQRSTPCEHAGDEVDELWSASHRRAVRDGLLATNAAFAEETWREVEGRFDAFAARWRDMRRDACVAHDQGAQSAELLELRNGCLEQRLEGLRALIDTFARADVDVVARAAEAAEELPSLQRCEDVEALRARLTQIEQPTPAQAPEVARLRGQLARARALEEAGQPGSGLELAASIVGEAESLGYRPLRAESLVRHGHALEAASRYDDAEAALMRALLDAEAARHDDAAAEAALVLVYVLAKHGERLEEATRWGDLAASIIERGALGPGPSASLHNSLGALWRARGDPGRALEHFERQVALLADTRGAESPRYARALGNLALAQQANGAPALARDTLQRAVTIVEGALGPEHPDIAYLRSNLGTVLRELGEGERALEELERASAILERAYGPEHEAFATAAANLGAALRDRGDHARAIEMNQKALTALEKIHGAEHVSVAMIRMNLGELALLEGAPQKALDELQSALRVVEAQLGPRHPNVAVVLVNTGLARLELDLLDAAEADLSRALSVFEAALPPKSPELAYPLTGLGQVALARDDDARASERLERALALRAPDLAPPADIAETEFALARALYRLDPEDRRARALAERAAERLRGLVGRWRLRDEIGAWLTRVDDVLPGANRPGERRP